MEDAVTDSNFWAIVGASAAIATALATAISAIAALWWRRADRKEADWAWLSARSSWYVVEGQTVDPPKAVASLANAGDGSAFRVEVKGNGCKTFTFRRITPGGSGASTVGVPLSAVMHPGDQIEVQVTCKDIKDWDNAEVVIAWTHSPTWKKKRNRKQFHVPLSEIAEKPGPDDGTNLGFPKPRPQ